MLQLIIFWLACFTIATVPVVFVWNHVYKDGIIGRAALLTMSFVAWSWILDAIIAGKFPTVILFRELVIITAMAVFLVWHLFRFHRRVVLKERKDAKPYMERDRRHTPDRRFCN